MSRKQQRVYVDASVIGGCLDEEFADDSVALLDLARRGEITLLVSTLMAAEIRLAPAEVGRILAGLPAYSVERLPITAETEWLRDLYLKAEVVGPASVNDAHHVAIATVRRADMIVSWNFRHIVHHEKIRGFNAVNLREGYPLINIYSPKEVV